VAALAERRRRHLVSTPAFDGCRCCYDPSSDGHGEYTALVEYKQQTILQSNGDDAAEPGNAHYHHHNQPPPPNDDDDDHNTREDSDDEFDYLLDEDFSPDNDDPNSSRLKQAEDARRVQLEWEILQRQVAIQHGYGTHRQLHPTRVLKAAGLGDNPSRSPPPAVVLHLVDPDSVASASLDYFLETRLAPQYPGTICVRSGGRSTLLLDAPLARKHLSKLNADVSSDLPALVAIRDGQVVNISKGLRDLCHYEGGEVEPRAVEMWLEQSGVLKNYPPPYDSLCYIRPEEEALMEYLGQKKPNQQQQEDRYFDCGLKGCTKTFPHEHVGIKTSAQDGLVLKEDVVLGSVEDEA
jgi:hypothetical protein